jgi:hypothetical protein
MAKVLKDPIAVKEKVNGVYPWSYNAPTKDQAHSGNIPAGNYYGVGHRTPVGKEKAGDMASGPIPQESKCFSPDEIFGKMGQIYGGEDKRG